MRILGFGLACVLVLVTTAHAQPGQQPPYQPPPQQPYVPPPQGYAPAAYGQPPTITPEEHQLLLRGEISEGAHILGGAASFFLGFGTGQAIQGRWSDTGWIFTLGESASIAMMIAGVVRSIDDCGFGHETCDDEGSADGTGMIVVGLVGFSVFRVWEIIDAIGGPSGHNRRVRELKWRLGIPVQVSNLQPYVLRGRDGGGTAGLRFDF
jgi:hypothetical protein